MGGSTCSTTYTGSASAAPRSVWAGAHARGGGEGQGAEVGAGAALVGLWQLVKGAPRCCSPPPLLLAPLFCCFREI